MAGPATDESSDTTKRAELAPLRTFANNAGDGIAPAVSPADLVKGASSITIGDHRYSRCGADSSSAGASFNLELDELLTRGSCGEVYTDATGTLAIKIVEPREDNVYNWIYDETPSEPLRRYESRLQEALNEVEAYKALEGCIFVPSFYGCFESVHEDGHKILVLVMERVTGELLTMKRVPAFVHKIEAAVRAVHRCGVRHGSVKPGHILLARDKIFLLDFGLSRLDPDVRQAETETARLRYIGA
ncbi:Protein kinase-like domain-containing protein [Rhodotorula toruloides]|uniref:Protein kinase-like domain-containing protein n=1 Tax=Rhodotorula toruloides TaxID=5286 RepID=A0A2T0AA06_RHOTO|nr:Protein kinase-like domain-containing protein [Rhodotorula toruloides]